MRHLLIEIILPTKPSSAGHNHRQLDRRKLARRCLVAAAAPIIGAIAHVIARALGF